MTVMTDGHTSGPQPFDQQPQQMTQKLVQMTGKPQRMTQQLVQVAQSMTPPPADE